MVRLVASGDVVHSSQSIIKGLINDLSHVRATRDRDLEAAVKQVLIAGLATGHADTFSALMEEVLAQYGELRTAYGEQCRQLRERDSLLPGNSHV